MQARSERYACFSAFVANTGRGEIESAAARLFATDIARNAEARYGPKRKCSTGYNPDEKTG